MPTLAPKLPWLHPFSGGYPRRGGQSLPTDADAIDYLSRLAEADGASVEVGIAQAIDAFVRGCKADGTWDAIQASCIMCGARTLSGALVPLKGTAPTPYNFASGDYSRSGATPGLKGNGSTKYLDTNRAQNADPQNDFHMACFGDGTLGYATAETGVSYLTPGFSRSRRNSGQTWGVSPAGNSFYGHSRASASEYIVRVNGGFLSPYSVVSETPSAQNTLTHKIATTFYDTRLAFYSVGAAIDLAAMDTRVTNLVTAIRFHTLTGLLPNDYDPATIAYIVSGISAGGTL